MEDSQIIELYWQKNADAISETSSKYGAYRHQNNNAYWTNFFGKSASRLGAYESSDSTFQKYLKDWADFQSGLIGGEVASVDVKA